MITAGTEVRSRGGVCRTILSFDLVAMVLSTKKNQIGVGFIDFGDMAVVNKDNLRQLAKKHCLAAPYAYRCTFSKATGLSSSFNCSSTKKTFFVVSSSALPNVNTETIAAKCAGREFNGEIKSKTDTGQFVLVAEEFMNILLEINAIE